MKAKLILIGLALSFSAQAQEYSKEKLTVYCGSLQTILKNATEKYDERPILTWVDNYGRYFVLGNKETGTSTLVLAVRDIDDGACIISAGDQLLVR